MSRQARSPIGDEFDDFLTSSGVNRLKTVSGFAIAICYLCFEAQKAGWHKTGKLLERAHGALLDDAEGGLSTNNAFYGDGKPVGQRKRSKLERSGADTS